MYGVYKKCSFLLFEPELMKGFFSPSRREDEVEKLMDIPFGKADRASMDAFVQVAYAFFLHEGPQILEIV